MINTTRASPTNSSPSDSASCSGSSTPQRTSSPFPITQQSMFHNGPLFTPPRALSPRAPIFQMTTSAPINVPSKPHPLENSIDENSPIEGNNSQPDRSDTPQSMNSTTSNESSDSGYCGYVESFPCKILIYFKIIKYIYIISFIDYYKLNRLYKALALQKNSTNTNRMGKVPHNRRVPNHIYRQQQLQQQQQEIIPTSFSTSPPTPTPMNIDRLAPFYAQQSFLPISTTATGSRKSKY